MTKKEMLDFIEKTGLITDLDKKYLMIKSERYIKGMYDVAVIYAQRKNTSC